MLGTSFLTRVVNPLPWTAWANLAVKRGNLAVARKLKPE